MTGSGRPRVQPVEVFGSDDNLAIAESSAELALHALVVQVAELFGSRYAELNVVRDDDFLLVASTSEQGSWIPSPEHICSQVVDYGRPIILPDARLDKEFANHPVVVGPQSLRFYAGTPLIASDGSTLGALCAWDTRPLNPGGADIQALQQFSRYATAMIELRQVAFELDRERTMASATGASLEMIVSGADLHPVLQSLTRAVEAAFPETRCSLMLLEGDRLRCGAGPSLPAEYWRAVDGLRIGPAAGSCGAAAFTGQTVIVSDIAADPRWNDCRDFALPFGLRACWAVPMKGQLGEVLGTFALYYDVPREPTDDEIAQVSRWVQLAEVAISRAEDMKKLRDAATLDALTGLLNRTEVIRRLEEAVSEGSTGVGVLFVDLDQFKIVNDTFGHPRADQFLKVVADRLTRVAGHGNIVARLGGDEFVILCPDIGDIGRAESLAHEVIKILRQPIAIEGKALSLSASVGVAISHRDASDQSADLIGDADLAMYAAKRAGRNSVAIFHPSLRQQAAARLSLEADLAAALRNGEMDCAYQPIVDIRTGQLTDIEALLRWDSPSRGDVSPRTFIPIAEESGLIIAVGEFVVRRACRQLAQWRRDSPGWRAVPVWVNVSPRQLRDIHFPEFVASVLKATDLPAEYLGIEVTESTLVGDAPGARSVLLELRSSGVRIAVDDFGTGYSSLAQLRRLPVDVLKIDQQFIADIDHEVAAAGIVEAIVTLARTMGLQVIAEGVETASQRSRLVELKCAKGQGFLWSYPRSAAELGPMISSITIPAQMSAT